MAVLLYTDPLLYFQGQVQLFAGDAWIIPFQLRNNYNGLEAPYNAQPASGVTAFFPVASGGVFPVVAAFTDSPNGFGSVCVPAAITQNLGSQDPASWYVQVQIPQGLMTIQTPDQPLIIGAPAIIS